MAGFVHPFFEISAVILAWIINVRFRNKHQIRHQLGDHEELYYWYLLAGVVGLFLGAYFFGSLNLWLSGRSGIAKSYLGGVFGAILLIEVYKKMIGFKRSTGLYFIPGLCVLIIVGRLGCFFGGLEDFTYGTATSLSWGYDFGDGISRHPVQLYESVSMLLFLITFLIVFKSHHPFWTAKGFYLFIFFYASQRFVWEFLKPYAAVVYSLNVFHVLTLSLMLWAAFQLMRKTQNA